MALCVYRRWFYRNVGQYVYMDIGPIIEEWKKKPLGRRRDDPQMITIIF